MARRYPIEPLIAKTGLTPRQFMDEARMSGTAMRRAEEDGLDADQADRYAMRFHWLPYEVWPDYGPDATKICKGCDKEFDPKRSDQKFHNRECGKLWNQREWRRQKYANDPEFAERIREQRRTYYAECGDYERARQARYDAEVRAPRRRQERAA